MTRAAHVPAQISIRLVWPYARLAAQYPGSLATLSRIGIGPAEYANPDTRLALCDSIELLCKSLEMSKDPALGLRAGELIEPGDFEVLEYAARSCATLREAIGCVGRYVRLLSDAATLSLVERANVAMLCYRIDEPLPQPPAANDFAMALLVNVARRNTVFDDLVSEVQFEHAPTTYIAEYGRVLRTKVSFSAPCNAIVFPREALDAPMRRADPRISAAFELQVRRRVQTLRENRSMLGRVRQLVFAELSRGNLTMQMVAKKLGMSVSTLRRRLEEEDTHFSAIVDALRESLARQYLREKNRATIEIAFLLGFADAMSFHKAFKRWTGQTPAAFRQHQG